MVYKLRSCQEGGGGSQLARFCMATQTENTFLSLGLDSCNCKVITSVLFFASTLTSVGTSHIHERNSTIQA